MRVHRIAAVLIMGLTSVCSATLVGTQVASASTPWGSGTYNCSFNGSITFKKLLTWKTVAPDKGTVVGTMTDCSGGVPSVSNATFSGHVTAANMYPMITGDGYCTEGSANGIWSFRLVIHYPNARPSTFFGGGDSTREGPDGLTGELSGSVTGSYKTSTVEDSYFLISFLDSDGNCSTGVHSIPFFDGSVTF